METSSVQFFSVSVRTPFVWMISSFCTCLLLYVYECQLVGFDDPCTNIILHKKLIGKTISPRKLAQKLDELFESPQALTGSHVKRKIQVSKMLKSAWLIFAQNCTEPVSTGSADFSWEQVLS